MDANTKAQYTKAQARAREMGGADKVTPLGDNRYSVLSSGGDAFYTVTVIAKATQDIYLCNCRAGQSSRCCWHKAATLAYRVREAMLTATIAATRPPPVGYERGQAARELWG